ncbi:basic proline-rich protein-like [Hippopotamus amphibius kiboko]|uniref:basic proline-rich protein-like n=1 Tax=Hippopotamus amphibius kiboko TaxID=575201 RepID=UPI00259194DB|nr:basic proline-rich protein-like [Hippopotamus amphibius kiboko]
MTPPPRVQLHSNWFEEAPPPPSSGPRDWLTDTRQVSSPPSIGSLPRQSHTARFGSVGGEGVGGGGVGVGLEDEVAEEGVQARPPAPETTRGREKREGPANQGPTHPRSRKRRLRDSPEGRGAPARSDDPGLLPQPTPRGPREKCPRARGVTVASRPGGPLPLPARGPEGLSLQGRGDGGEKRGRWRANPEPPGPPPAPSPGPSAPAAHTPAPRKLSQRRARLGAAAVRPPAPRPHRGRAWLGPSAPPAPPAAAPSRPPAARGAPRPPPPGLTRARPGCRAAAPLLPASQLVGRP